MPVANLIHILMMQSTKDRTAEYAVEVAVGDACAGAAARACFQA